MAQSYIQDDKAVREDLLDVLKNLSPTERQLTNGLGVSKANQLYHESLVDTLDSVAVNAYAQGSDACYRVLTNPTRIANFVQTLRKGWMVPSLEDSINTAAFSKRTAHEKIKALESLGNDLEFALMRGSLVSGSGTVASQMRGLKNSLSLVTSQSGISLTQKILEDYFQLVWDNTSTEVNAVYSSMYIKRKISGYTTKITQFAPQDDKRLQLAVDIYQSDAAKMVKLFAHRYVKNGSDTNHDVVGVNEEFFKVAYIRKPFSEDRAKTGDAEKGEITTDATLEVRHYNAGFNGQKHL